MVDKKVTPLDIEVFLERFKKLLKEKEIVVVVQKSQDTAKELANSAESATLAQCRSVTSTMTLDEAEAHLVKVVAKELRGTDFGRYTDEEAYASVNRYLSSAIPFNPHEGMTYRVVFPPFHEDSALLEYEGENLTDDQKTSNQWSLACTVVGMVRNRREFYMVQQTFDPQTKFRIEILAARTDSDSNIVALVCVPPEIKVKNLEPVCKSSLPISEQLHYLGVPPRVEIDFPDDLPGLGD